MTIKTLVISVIVVFLIGGGVAAFYVLDNRTESQVLMEVENDKVVEGDKTTEVVNTKTLVEKIQPGIENKKADDRSSADKIMADITIKGNLANTRVEGELYYDTNGSYAGLCTNTKVYGMNTVNILLQRASDDAMTGKIVTSGAAQTSQTANCFATSTAWAASVKLVTPSVPTYFCVDSSGHGKETTKPLPTNTAVCS